MMLQAARDPKPWSWVVFLGLVSCLCFVFLDTLSDLFLFGLTQPVVGAGMFVREPHPESLS